MIQTLAFYLFAFMVIASAVMVIMARNPVHSVLWLILAFFNAAGLMVLLGAEFIAMLLVIVYVGAVAVLFLFVVMMLDIDFAELRAGFVRNFPLGLLVALILFAELVVGLVAHNAGGLAPHGAAAAAAQAAGANGVIGADGASMSNIEAFGALFFTRYLFLFEAAGLILLVAMIGAIVLTHRRRRDGMRSQQDIGRQNRRRPGDAIIMKQPKVGEGVEL